MYERESVNLFSFEYTYYLFYCLVYWDPWLTVHWHFVLPSFFFFYHLVLYIYATFVITLIPRSKWVLLLIKDNIYAKQSKIKELVAVDLPMPEGGFFPSSPLLFPASEGDLCRDDPFRGVFPFSEALASSVFPY